MIEKSIYNLTWTADTEYLKIFRNLSKKEFEKFKQTPEEFDDERVYFLYTDYIRNLTLTGPRGGEKKLNQYSIDVINLSDLDELSEKERNKAIYKKIDKKLAEASSCLNDMKPNTITVISRFQVYKEIDEFTIKLNKSETFSNKKLHFVLFEPGIPVSDIFNKENTFWDHYEQIFPEDCISTSTIVYDNTICDCELLQDFGEHGHNGTYYALYTDKDGKVYSIDKFQI